MSVNADRIVTAAMTELRGDGFKVDEAAAQAPVGTTGKSGLELNLKAIADAVVDEFTEHWTGGGSWGNLPDGDGVPQRVGDVWSMVQGFLTKTAADALYATTSALSTVATSAASALATATTAAAAADAAMAAIPAAASTAPLMDGVVSVGTASAYARADHRHPTDTSREAAITAGSAGQWWRYDKTWSALSVSDVGGLGTLATMNQIADAQVATAAAIAWSKISKVGASAADVGALAATAAASGDLTGSYPSPIVAGLRGYALPTLSTTAGGLRWSGTAWTLDSTSYLSTTVAAATYQAKITTGTTAQYLRGDLSLAPFPTAVSAFSNDAGYITSAGSASALGGVASDYFVRGSNSTRTTLLSGAVTSQSQLLKSGFYCSQQWTDSPVASTWTHLIHCHYANETGSSNTWSFDLAANFGSAASPGAPEGYYVRAIASGASTGWRTLIHSANYSSFNNFASGLTSKYATVDGQYYSTSGALASFGHKSCTASTNYCLLQDSGGTTYLNSSSIIHFQNNNRDVATIDANGINGALNGTATNANQLAGLASDYYVQGNGGNWGVRTTHLLGSLSQGLKSGFYDNDGTNNSGSPTGGWCHMIVNAHYISGSGNQYQWELASGFWNEEIYSRKITPDGAGLWRNLIHSANYPSFNNYTSGLTTTVLTASGAITANGGIIGQGNIGASAQPWNAGFFSAAGIDIGSGLLKIYSPNSTIALLGIAAHPISLSTASGAATFPSDLNIGGALGLPAVSVGNTTYYASAHKGRILTIAPSTSFTLPLGSAGDWFILQSSDIQGPGQSAGKIIPSGATVYIRGVACSSFVSVIGVLVAYCNGVYWYIG